MKDSTGENKICFITTSMGRLQHVKQSLPVLMSQPNSSTILVDYSCPDGSGRWAEENFPECEIVRIPGKEYFSLTKARNAAIPRVVEIDCNWLCFIDADTIIVDKFTELINSLLEKNIFITGYNIHNDVKGLGGLLIVPKNDFLRIGGYDENIEGYGTNASEMRLRLYFNGLDYKILPDGMVSHIKHNHSKTFSRYREDQKISLYKNTKRLLSKIKRWEKETGKTVPPELYKRHLIEGIEASLPFRKYPLVALKVFIRKIKKKINAIISSDQ